MKRIRENIMVNIMVFIWVDIRSPVIFIITAFISWTFLIFCGLPWASLNFLFTYFER